LLEAIAGLLPIDSGIVLWRESMLPYDRRRDSIFFLPDALQPWQEQRVVRVLEFFASVCRRPNSVVANTIQLLGLSPVLRKRVDALSKGFGRRLMLRLRCSLRIRCCSWTSLLTGSTSGRRAR
jgi:ABC-2 type transport system ATP-binding protein